MKNVCIQYLTHFMGIRKSADCNIAMGMSQFLKQLLYFYARLNFLINDLVIPN